MERIKIAFSLFAGVLVSLSTPNVAARASTAFAQNGGTRIAYEVVGEGEPIVLIPGFSQSRQAWKAAGFVDAFTSRGRQVILIDPRGHGESDKPHDEAAYRMDRLTGDVVTVLDTLGIQQADLLGYSRGGAIALATAALHSRRAKSVIAGGAHPYAEDMSPFRNAIAGGLSGWVQAIEKSTGPLPADARRMFLSNDVEALRAAVAADRSDFSIALVASRVPILLYAGSEDPRADLARRFAAEAAADYLELPGLDHFNAFFAVEPVVQLPNAR